MLILGLGLNFVGSGSHSPDLLATVFNGIVAPVVLVLIVLDQ